MIFFRFIAFPLATKLGLKDHDADKKIMKSEKLESFYSTISKIPKDVIKYIYWMLILYRLIPNWKIWHGLFFYSFNFLERNTVT